MSNDIPNILIVDDEPFNLILLGELLRSKGYRTRKVSSGMEAIEILKIEKFDLILLDVMMPEMTGFQVCKELRQDHNLMNLPIIFITALDDEQSRIEGLELMADDYITKPFNSRLLLAKIESVLQLQKKRSQTLSSEVTQKVSQSITEKLKLFVPPQFLERIAPQGVNSIQLGNVSQEELTILFCDIRDFTGIAESQEAEKTFLWLNAFFAKMGNCITSNHGFIDKYLGDAIMAIFDQSNLHANHAINAAVMMEYELLKFNQMRYDYDLVDPVRIGIGIHTGIAMIGTVGSDRRMDSTVIGDVVNTASRLESLTKVYSCQILASDLAINHALKSTQSLNYYFRWIDQLSPRGKQEIIQLYEVWGTTHPDAQLKVKTQPIFEKGLGAWKGGKYAIALAYFQEVLNYYPQDFVAFIYQQRCQEKL